LEGRGRSPQARENQARLRHLWVRHFATVEELRLALQASKETYNRSWIIERHGYKTPAQVRADQIGPMAMAA
jgi:putative transposase